MEEMELNALLEIIKRNDEAFLSALLSFAVSLESELKK